MTRLRLINDFDGSFTLNPEAKEALFILLRSESFLQQVSEQVHCQQVEFTELVFQPVPYSQATPKGMARAYEQYYQSGDHAIVNVPPHFMFKAKIFNPSRLCAVYQVIPSSS